jgi:antitoxin PrlF
MVESGAISRSAEKHAGAGEATRTFPDLDPQTLKTGGGCPLQIRPRRHALTAGHMSITFIEIVLPRPVMTTTITVKGQVTLPKTVRDAVGLKPGDKVEVRATASGGVYIEKQGAAGSYREQLKALAKRRLIKGMTTDEFTEFSRGESAEYRPKAK